MVEIEKMKSRTQEVVPSEGELKANGFRTLNEEKRDENEVNLLSEFCHYGSEESMPKIRVNETTVLPGLETRQVSIRIENWTNTKK